MIMAIRNTHIPVTPINAINFNFSIFFTRANGNYNRAITITIKDC